MVEWKKLGDVCEILDSQRKPVSKKNRRAGNYPYYGANGVQDYVEEFIFDGTYLLLGEDGSVINEDKSPVLHWAIGKIWVNNHAHILQENSSASLRYLYYILQCTDVSDIVRGMPPKINQANMRNILLPIPSLSEQNRIVGILDTFTASIENLKEQIAQRRKQYEYYRDQLLDLEGKEGVEMKTLGELSDKISSGRNKNKLEEGLYPVFGSTGIIAFTNTFIFDKELILVARVGANAGYVYMTNEKCDVTDNTLIVETKENCSRKFIYYYLVYKNINQYAKGGGQPLITGGLLKELFIPIPSLSEQQRIVDILDKFEASIQNLEAQLSLREKQYEYYRNKLLTFD